MSTPSPAPIQPPSLPPPLPPAGDDKLWMIFSHLSILLGVGVLLPLIIYLVKKNESAAVASQAKEALNFHLSLLIYAFGCIITVIGIPLLIGIVIGAYICAIIAAVEAAGGKSYLYPLTLRLVK